MLLRKINMFLCLLLGVVMVDAHREVVIAVNNTWQRDITLRYSAFDGDNSYRVQCKKGLETLLLALVPDDICLELIFGIVGIEGFDGGVGKVVFEGWEEKRPGMCNLLQVKTDNFEKRSFLYQAKTISLARCKTPELLQILGDGEDTPSLDTGSDGSDVATVGSSFSRRTPVSDEEAESSTNCPAEIIIFVK